MGRILDLFLKIELWISIDRRQKDILESSIYGISSNIVNSRFSILVTQCDDLLTLGQVKSRGRVKRASLLLYFRLILAIISSTKRGLSLLGRENLLGLISTAEGTIDRGRR